MIATDQIDDVNVCLKDIYFTYFELPPGSQSKSAYIRLFPDKKIRLS